MRARPRQSGGSQRVLAYQKVTVPYFDLALYGLEDYYFRSEIYVPGESGSGSTDEPYGQITLLHLFIYELERDFCGLAEEQCGKGYLKEKNLIGTDVFNVSGSSGSFFMQNIWNHDPNLLYYVNYQFPIASEGYGSTADQILLREGDVVSMSLYTDWSFYSDEAAGFHHLGTPTNMVQGPIEAKSDETLDLTLYRSSAAMGDKEHQTACGNLDVYYTRADSVPVINAAIDALSSSLTEEAISSIDTQLKALSPVALASIPNLELLVTMLCRYAQLKGCDVSGLASLSDYTDASGVSDWALQSMQWAVSAGLIAGLPKGRFPPGSAFFLVSSPRI